MDGDPKYLREKIFFFFKYSTIQSVDGEFNLKHFSRAFSDHSWLVHQTL